MRDYYQDFYDLQAHEQSHDYQIETQLRPSQPLILAIHGGWIEPGTTELAKGIAGDDLSYYVFNGYNQDGRNTLLHLTSTRFNEPLALSMVQQAEQIISIHGCRDIQSGEQVTYLGGLDLSLRQNIIYYLQKAGFNVQIAPSRLRGEQPDNICNRGRTSAGVQLELTTSLRDLIRLDDRQQKNSPFPQYIQAVRKALEIKEMG